MRGGIVRRYRRHRQLQMTADDLGDVARRDAFVRYCVIAGAGQALLQRQPVKPRHIQPVRPGPAVAAIADIARDALLPRDREKPVDQTAFAVAAMPWGSRTAMARTPRAAKARPAVSDTRGRPGITGSFSVASRPGATSSVPEVTMNGLSDPASSSPMASMACLSSWPFSANFEKSWMKARWMVPSFVWRLCAGCRDHQANRDVPWRRFSPAPRHLRRSGQGRAPRAHSRSILWLWRYR